MSTMRAVTAAAAALLLLPLALLLQLFLAATPAAAHGMLVRPESRNWRAYLHEHENYAHGLNLGGPGYVSKKGELAWPKGRRGMCGDRANETRWTQPRDVAARYVSGSVIELDALIATNHLGRFDVRVCPLDTKGDQADKKCKYLTRADGKGADDNGKKFWFLPFVKKWGGGNYGGDPPAYGDGRCVFCFFFVFFFVFFLFFFLFVFLLCWYAPPLLCGSSSSLWLANKKIASAAHALSTPTNKQIKHKKTPTATPGTACRSCTRPRWAAPRNASATSSAT